MEVERFSPYLGIAVAFLFSAFVVAFSGSVTVLHTPTLDTHTASSTLSVVPGFTLPPLTLPDFHPTPEQAVADTAATSSSRQTTTPVPKKITEPTTKAKITPIPTPTPVAVVVPTTPVLVPPPLSSPRDASLDSPASTLVSALVNIICLAPRGSGLHSISGSGVFVDSRGIILTNAHVAQYFLLADRGVSCVVRSGSPAVDSYKATLIYISPSWLRANTTVLTEAEPSGTGESDFAFLVVNSSTTAEPIPSSFPFVPLATSPPSSGTPVVIASYGAQFLESNQIRSALFPTLVYGSVKDVFTFAVNTIDVLALGGSAVAQEGSSGGGVADKNGKLVGTITTSTVQGAVDTRSLNAITASYIRAEYANETGEALDLLLAEPTATAITSFATQIPTLEAIITAHLP